MTEEQRAYFRAYYAKNREKITQRKRQAYRPHRNTHGYFSKQSIDAAYEQRINDNRTRLKES